MQQLPSAASWPHQGHQQYHQQQQQRSPQLQLRVSAPSASRWPQSPESSISRHSRGSHGHTKHQHRHHGRHHTHSHDHNHDTPRFGGQHYWSSTSHYPHQPNDHQSQHSQSQSQDRYKYTDHGQDRAHDGNGSGISNGNGNVLPLQQPHQHQHQKHEWQLQQQYDRQRCWQCGHPGYVVMGIMLSILSWLLCIAVSYGQLPDGGPSSCRVIDNVISIPSNNNDESVTTLIYVHDNCYCEACSTSLYNGILEPCNTWSSLAYTIAGLIMIARIPSKEYIIDPASSLPSTTATWSCWSWSCKGTTSSSLPCNSFVRGGRDQQLSLLHALFVLAIGPSSALFHSSLSWTGSFIDTSSVLLYISFILVHEWTRWRSVPSPAWQRLILFGVLCSILLTWTGITGGDDLIPIYVIATITIVIIFTGFTRQHIRRIFIARHTHMASVSEIWPGMLLSFH
jgi:hypothetical protein